MSLHRSLLAATVAAGFALGASQYALAQGYGHGGHGGFAQILSAVQLTSAQKQQIHSIMSSTRTQNQAAMTQLRTLQTQMESTMFSSGDVTAAQITPIQQQIETLRDQLDASRIQTGLAIRNVLTSAQLAKAASVQAQLSSLHQQEHAIMEPAATTTAE